jgi:uncharacterized protein (TIGR02145 family)/prepilin-type N-terminal cleavage/methylation domain-containing protein
MKPQKKQKKKAFTLVEILIVVALIAILIVTVIMLINPGQRLVDARNAVREAHIKALESVTYAYKVDNGSFPEDITTTLTEICNTNLETPDCTDLVDLSMLDFPVLPVDPEGGITENGTGYKVKEIDGRLYFEATNMETTEEEEPAWACGDDITDSRDGTVYSTVEIGTQCWTAENMAYLPSVVGASTGSYSTPHYYVYDYNGTDVSIAKATSNYATYGVLYNWPAALTACPSDWHIATHPEWGTIETYLTETGTCDLNRFDVFVAYSCLPAGAKMAGNASLWTWDQIETNPSFESSGLNLLPGGGRYTSPSMSFQNIGTFANYWTGSDTPTNPYRSGDIAHFRYIGDSSEGGITVDSHYKTVGHSVRCVMD